MKTYDIFMESISGEEVTLRATDNSIDAALGQALAGFEEVVGLGKDPVRLTCHEVIG